MSLEPSGDDVVVGVDISAEIDGRPATWRRTVTYRVSDGLIAHAEYVEGDQALSDRVFAKSPPPK